MWIAAAAIVTLLLAWTGGRYRSRALEMLPPENLDATLYCRGCGTRHPVPPHRLRYRIYRFVTMPLAGIFYAVAILRRRRYHVLLAEAAVQVAVGIIRGTRGDADIDALVGLALTHNVPFDPDGIAQLRHGVRIRDMHMR